MHLTRSSKPRMSVRGFFAVVRNRRAGLVCWPACPRYESTSTKVYSRAGRTGPIFLHDDTNARRTITAALLTQETLAMARSPEVTLLEVIQAVREVAATEQETLATVVHLLTSGQVRLSDEAISGMQALGVTTIAAA